MKGKKTGGRKEDTCTVTWKGCENFIIVGGRKGRRVKRKKTRGRREERGNLEKAWEFHGNFMRSIIGGDGKGRRMEGKINQEGKQG